ncbi:hypothetical protein EDB19DRAFT_1643291 [Suillus lakei]|nr:hypothetical protein EDB19DRAFT_1643291 [Suillus lakei]
MQSHIEELRRVWIGPVSSYINPHRWKNFYSKLMSEWSSITMYSTVMLAVDISFLAVPSVNVQGSRSVPVATMYISVFWNIGSLVASLFMLTNSTFGIQALATVHALPFAMLLWHILQ